MNKWTKVNAATLLACAAVAVAMLTTVRASALSRRFASRIADRFEGIAWSEGEGRIPLIGGAAAQMQCRNETRHYSGDHVILIGQVVKYLYRDVEPLVFARGAYRSLRECAPPDG